MTKDRKIQTKEIKMDNSRQFGIKMKLRNSNFCGDRGVYVVQRRHNSLVIERVEKILELIIAN